MDAWPAAAASALWLGVLTSLSPCPAASNIAAISFVGRHVALPRQVALIGLAYTLGRMLTYVALCVLIVSSLLGIPALSNALQYWMNRIIGPVLIVSGMLLVEWIRVGAHGRGIGPGTQRLAERSGALGAFALGALFALAFCPVSAALFFGSLIPLALHHGSRFWLPSLYGAGTALPVIACAFAIAAGSQATAKLFGKLRAFEGPARRITGAVFILVGIYYSLRYIYGLWA